MFLYSNKKNPYPEFGGLTVIFQTDQGILFYLKIFLIEFKNFSSWLCTLLHQLNPLIGPQLSNETAKALQHLWGDKF